jgi:hypothetical protein
MVQKKRNSLFSLATFGFPFLILTFYSSFFNFYDGLILLDNGEGFSLTISEFSLPACIIKNKNCRFDQPGKYIEESAVFTIAHPISDALPENRKVSQSEAHNVTFMKKTRSIGPSDGSETPLFEYNPTIVPITDDWDEKLKSYVTGRYHPNISSVESDRVQYIFIARASNLHSCVKGTKKMQNPTKEQSFLSITLLDSDLNPIENASVIVSPMHAMMPSCYQKSRLSYFQDYQVIAARSTKSNPKKDQLFLFASDKASYMFPMDLRRVPGITNEYKDWKTKMISVPIQMNNPPFSYGMGLQIRFWKNKDLIPKGVNPYCNHFLKFNSIGLRKNYHFFEESNLTFMEHRPHWIRATQQISFISNRFHQFEDWTTSKRFPNNKRIVNRIKNEPDLTFLPPNTTAWMKRREGRGTSCCIDILSNSSKKYKVGISHETTLNRGYVSRFYAFEVKKPHFFVVAISGAFCLQNINRRNDRFGRTQVVSTSFLLQQNSQVYNCPEVTFLSGISTYQKDRTLAIISYGINDCISRSIIVPKRVILKLLALD